MIADFVSWMSCRQRHYGRTRIQPVKIVHNLCKLLYNCITYKETLVIVSIHSPLAGIMVRFGDVCDN